MCRQARPNRRNPKSSKSSLTFQNGESPPSSLPSWDSLLKILQKSASVNCTTGSTQFVPSQTLLLPSSILSANHELCPWSHQSFTGISRSLYFLIERQKENMNMGNMILVSSRAHKRKCTKNIGVWRDRDREVVVGVPCRVLIETQA